MLLTPDDEDYEWEPPTESEMKVIQARRERQDKISKLMGDYLLKGYKMLGECCDVCQVSLWGQQCLKMYTQWSDVCVCVKLSLFCVSRQSSSRTDNRKTTVSHVRSWTLMLTRTTLVYTTHTLSFKGGDSDSGERLFSILFVKFSQYIVTVCSLSVLCVHWKEIRCSYTALAL